MADYLRVTHPFATLAPCKQGIQVDLHVLGTPPAFVLSQDQTLRCKVLNILSHCPYSPGPRTPSLSMNNHQTLFERIKYTKQKSVCQVFFYYFLSVLSII